MHDIKCNSKALRKRARCTKELLHVRETAWHSIMKTQQLENETEKLTEKECGIIVKIVSIGIHPTR